MRPITWPCRAGSAEVFHEHDVAAAVVLLGIQNPSPVGRHGNPRHKRDRLSVQRGNVDYPAPSKAQKLLERAEAWPRCSRSRCRSPPEPSSPKSSLWENPAQVLLRRRSLPRSIDRRCSCLSRSTGICHPATRTRANPPRFVIWTASAASGRHFPDLRTSRARGREVDRLSIPRPARDHAVGMFAGHAPRWASIDVDDVNTALPIERDAAAIRRPPRSSDRGAAKRSQLHQVGTRTVAHPDLRTPCAVGTKRDSRAIG